MTALPGVRERGLGDTVLSQDLKVEEELGKE